LTETATETPSATATASETASATFGPTEPATATSSATPLDTPTLGPTEPATFTPIWAETATAFPTLTLPPTLTATATLPSPFGPEPPLQPLLTDTFDTGALYFWTLGKGWSLIASEGGQALANPAGDEPVTFVHSTLTDLAVQVRVRFEAGMFRLSLRQSEAGAYTALLSADGQVALYRGTTALASAVVAPNQPGQWRTLRLSAIGDLLRVQADGVEVIAVQDAAPLPQGTFSFAGVGASGGVTVDDVAVEWVQPAESMSPLFTPPAPPPSRQGGIQLATIIDINFIETFSTTDPYIDPMPTPAPGEPAYTPAYSVRNDAVSGPRKSQPCLNSSNMLVIGQADDCAFASGETPYNDNGSYSLNLERRMYLGSSANHTNAYNVNWIALAATESVINRSYVEIEIGVTLKDISGNNLFSQMLCRATPVSGQNLPNACLVVNLPPGGVNGVHSVVFYIRTTSPVSIVTGSNPTALRIHFAELRVHTDQQNPIFATNTPQPTADLATVFPPPIPLTLTPRLSDINADNHIPTPQLSSQPFRPLCSRDMNPPGVAAADIPVIASASGTIGLAAPMENGGNNGGLGNFQVLRLPVSSLPIEIRTLLAQRYPRIATNIQANEGFLHIGFAHLSQIRVGERTPVARETQVAATGDSGLPVGSGYVPHLDVSVYYVVGTYSEPWRFMSDNTPRYQGYFAAYLLTELAGITQAIDPLILWPILTRDVTFSTPIAPCEYPANEGVSN
jgi:hypothetical protein